MKIEPRMRFDNLLKKTIEHFKLGRLSQQEEEIMNDNLNTTTFGGLNTPEFKPVPTQLKFTDKELEQLLEGKPFDGQVFVTDADETDEPTPTVH